MECRWYSEEFPYNGEQLSTLWIRERFGLQGDSIVAWVGRTAVLPGQHMLDLEDIEQSAVITSDSMLHFVCEIFDSHPSMELATTRQRLFSAIVFETLCFRGELQPSEISRKGDDIYLHPMVGVSQKLSVSIATISLQSTLFHFGMNVTTKGTPSNVSCGSLAKILPSILVEGLAKEVEDAFAEEIAGISIAAAGKVKTV